MSMPAKCFECGLTVCHLYVPYHKKLKEKKGEEVNDNTDIFKDLGINNICCRNIVANSVPDDGFWTIL